MAFFASSGSGSGTGLAQPGAEAVSPMSGNQISPQMTNFYGGDVGAGTTGGGLTTDAVNSLNSGNANTNALGSMFGNYQTGGVGAGGAADAGFGNYQTANTGGGLTNAANAAGNYLSSQNAGAGASGAYTLQPNGSWSQSAPLGGLTGSTLQAYQGGMSQDTAASNQSALAAQQQANQGGPQQQGSPGRFTQNSDGSWSQSGGPQTGGMINAATMAGGPTNYPAMMDPPTNAGSWSQSGGPQQGGMIQQAEQALQGGPMARMGGMQGFGGMQGAASLGSMAGNPPPMSSFGANTPMAANVDPTTNTAYQNAVAAAPSANSFLTGQT